MNIVRSRRVVVIGNGMVGSRFVADVLRRDMDRQFQITIVGDEPGGAYNRMQLSTLLAGATKAEDIVLASVSWYASQGVRLISGVAASQVDRVARTVDLTDGTTVDYDVLVLATGSEAIVPPLDGLPRDGAELPAGVVLFRTLADCAQIEDRSTNASHAIVIGGGLLGLEAARGLVGRGLPTTVLQRGPRLMDQQLDARASVVLERTLRRSGIVVRADVEPAAVLCAPLGDGCSDGRASVHGVVLADGTRIAGDLLVLCCGVRPRVTLARNAGLEVGRGVIVDDELRSVTDRNVFAIGECAEHNGIAYGVVAPGWEQSSVAAAALVGESATYRGSSVVTRLKAAGIELATMGETAVDDEDDVVFIDAARGVYQKLVVRDGRLVGAILLGDTRAVATVMQTFDRGAALPVDRASLLLVRRNSPVTSAASPMALPGHATICHCNGVTKTAICDAWQDGAESVAAIATRTRATTGCGTCRDAVQGLVHWMSAADTGARQVLTDEATHDTDIDTSAVPV